MGAMALDLEALRRRLNERRDVVLERLRSASESLDELDRSQPSEAEEEAQELNIARPQVTLDQRSRHQRDTGRPVGRDRAGDVAGRVPADLLIR